MAIPTDFKGYTPAAGTTKSFNILGSATVGVWGNDVDGTFTPSKVPIAPNMVLLMAQTYTDAQILAALQEFMARAGVSAGGAGSPGAQPSKLVAITSTTTT